MLNFYLVTTILSIAIDLLMSKAIEERIKREGYIYLKKEKSLSEIIIEIIKSLPHMLIPIWNMIFPILGITKFEEIYNSFLNSQLEKGEIIKKTIEEVVKVKTNSEENENINEDRFLLKSKTKIEFFDRINNLIIKIENISDNEVKKNLILKLKEVTNQFNLANAKLESLDPDKRYLLMEDKITIEAVISKELDEIENICNNLSKKQERINEDSKQFKKIFERINILQNNKR